MIKEISLFIFRRDLRLYDNIGLIEAIAQSAHVIPCFIFTPEQIESNPYRSDHCLQFMIDSLEDLQEQLREKKGKLFFFQGEPHEVVQRCIEQLNIDAVFANRDYTPYSKRRDQKIAVVCREKHIEFQLYDDALEHSPEDTLKSNGEPYLIFSPYFRRIAPLTVDRPRSCRLNRFYNGSIAFAKSLQMMRLCPQRNRFCLHGGRKEGLYILRKINDFENYGSIRDIPSLSTTHLSPYLKFNVLSVREVYHTIASKLGDHHELLRSIAWREFFTDVAFFFPRVFRGAFHSKFDALYWKNNRTAFQKWCEGKTGIPIVDAGMRELNETGFMHNRLRMITASFLVKDLHIDWRWGEKYFARQLIDYDPAVNNGNWQWVASTGCDAQPYFRMFNPWNQQKRFDPDCLYIKKWIPELKKESTTTIHQWKGSADYPAPMLKHAEESQIALQYYRSLFSNYTERT